MRTAAIAFGLLLTVSGALGLASPDIRRWVLGRGLSPIVAARIASASAAPVEIALASRVIEVRSLERGNVPPEPSENRVVLRVPAAAVLGVHFGSPNARERPPGAAGLALEVWSRSFDPVAPDRLADNRTCRFAADNPCAPLGSDGGRMVGRHAGGEYPRRIDISNQASTDAAKHAQLRYLAGMIASPYNARPVPCEFREEPELGMLVGRIPAGQRAGMACNIRFTRWVETRTGRSPELATFLRREPDGSPRFAVVCRAFVEPAEDVRGYPCTIHGYFGIWPLSFDVLGGEVREWDAIFTSVLDFLTQHTVSRTD